MVQANELRIGNWVKDNANDYFIIRSVSTDRLHPINVTDKIGYAIDCLLSDLSPIPLTPEILEKCGFKLNSISENWEIDLKLQGIIGLHSEDFSLWIGDKSDSLGFTGGLKSRCFFLHQLQNLYYSLTGTELNYQK